MRTGDSDILATISASAPRRWLGVLCIYFLGGLLLWIAMARPPAIGWQFFLVTLGAAALWLGEQMRRATRRVLELTREELRDDTGYVLARVEDIQKVDRGMFAFKPSNGFLLRTRSAAPRTWQPGLWWRLGRRIGVGGVTAAAQTKFMSEILSALIVERDQDG